MARQDPSDDDLTVNRTGDFLAEQGITDPAEFRVKSHLCHEIAVIADRRADAGLAELADEAERDVERIVRGRHDGFEVWRLIRVLTAVGADVGIYVLPVSGHERGIVLSETIGRGAVEGLSDEDLAQIQRAKVMTDSPYNLRDIPEVPA